jgi:tripartite ATP-independent transporter DctM subunit
MSPINAGIVGIIILVIMLFSRMPVGFVMAILGFVGFSLLVDFRAGLSLIARDVFEIFGSYSLTVIPLFILMGQIAFHSGISRRLYDAAFKIMGRMPGGLAIATVVACAGFSAVSGSTNATAATMATVALPEMQRYRYNMRLATGTVAAGGSLGILIPPSVIFIVYGILTEQSIGKLFAAGIIPGIILASLFSLTILIRASRNPSWAPMGPSVSFWEKVRSMAGVIETLILFALVMGGMFFGIFTPTEAAAVGAFCTMMMAFMRRRLTLRALVQSLAEATRISCMVMVIVTGATIFGHFLAITTVPMALASWVSNLPLPPYAIMGVIVLVYLLGGCFMDALGMIMLTIPIFYPVAIAMGFDPIWFGVVIVLVTEMGVITPPVGVNVYVVKGIAPSVPLETIFRGALPFLLSLLALVGLLLAFPKLALFLPSIMR